LVWQTYMRADSRLIPAQNPMPVLLCTFALDLVRVSPGVMVTVVVCVLVTRAGILEGHYAGNLLNSDTVLFQDLSVSAAQICWTAVRTRCDTVRMAAEEETSARRQEGWKHEESKMWMDAEE
jgi:hypothetical protein